MKFSESLKRVEEASLWLNSTQLISSEVSVPV
jgi:hypothetical protein